METKHPGADLSPDLVDAGYAAARYYRGVETAAACKNLLDRREKNRRSSNDAVRQPPWPHRLIHRAT